MVGREGRGRKVFKHAHVWGKGQLHQPVAILQVQSSWAQGQEAMFPGKKQHAHLGRKQEGA